MFFSARKPRPRAIDALATARGAFGVACSGLGVACGGLLVACGGLGPAAAPSPQLSALVEAPPRGIAPTTLASPGPFDAPSALLTTSPSREIPAHAYAALDARTCAARLAARKVPFAFVTDARGVDAPIRLTGPLHGVDLHGEPRAKRATSPFEILDCRLALALDDFAAVLAANDVVEAVHMSMYRPPSARPPRGTKRPSNHGVALAIDLGALVLRDGTRLVVDRDWHGRIGAPACGPRAVASPASAASTTLRRVLCAAVDAKTFHLVLTPNHDRRHHNHFHLEVVRGVSWFIVE